MSIQYQNNIVIFIYNTQCEQYKLVWWKINQWQNHTQLCDWIFLPADWYWNNRIEHWGNMSP